MPVGAAYRAARFFLGPSMQVNVYVDGFNLYYGALNNTSHKWLDLERLFTRLRNHDDIQIIYYFTALVVGTHAANQMAYLRAVETLPKVETVLGRFKDVTMRCKVRACNYAGARLFRKPEEKRTDVNIALHMARDAWRGTCEGMILVSGDSDIVPAVQMVKEMKPDLKVIVYVPARSRTRGAAVELRGAADSRRPILVADGASRRLRRGRCSPRRRGSGASAAPDESARPPRSHTR